MDENLTDKALDVMAEQGNELIRLRAELAAARAEVERATAAADAAWKTVEMVTRATAAKTDRGDTYKRRALALLNVARQARGCYWAAMGAGEALRRERDAVTAELDKAITEIKFQVERNDKEHAALKETISRLVDAEAARADCARQLAAERALLEQVYGTVTRLDVYLMHNRRNFQFDKAQDFIHRLYALTDAQQVDVALATHPAEGETK